MNQRQQPLLSSSFGANRQRGSPRDGHATHGCLFCGGRSRITPYRKLRDYCAVPSLVEHLRHTDRCCLPLVSWLRSTMSNAVPVPALRPPWLANWLRSKPASSDSLQGDYSARDDRESAAWALMTIEAQYRL